MYEPANWGSVHFAYVWEGMYIMGLASLTRGFLRYAAVGLAV